MEAFFLEHEGYFGALGAFLESAFGDKVDEILLNSSKLNEMNDDENEGDALRFVSNSNLNQRLSGSNLSSNSSNDNGTIETKRNNWKESLLSSSNENPPTLRRLRTQSLDSRDPEINSIATMKSKSIAATTAPTTTSTSTIETREEESSNSPNNCNNNN